MHMYMLPTAPQRPLVARTSKRSSEVATVAYRGPKAVRGPHYNKRLPPLVITLQRPSGCRCCHASTWSHWSGTEWDRVPEAVAPLYDLSFNVIHAERCKGGVFFFSIGLCLLKTNNR